MLPFEYNYSTCGPMLTTILTWSCTLTHAGSVFFMDLVDHVSDPLCLCGAGQGWTPSVSFHWLWTQPRASGEETAAQGHQQGPGLLSWQRDCQGPGAQHIVRIQKSKLQHIVCLCVFCSCAKTKYPKAKHRQTVVQLITGITMSCCVSLFVY